MEPENRNDARTMYVQSAFERGSDYSSATHNPPRAKTISNPTFCRRGSWRLFRTESGMATTKMSVMMVTPAQKYQKANRFMQCPGTVLFQNRAMGMQARPVPTMPIVPKMQMKVSRTQQSVRTRPSRMNRRSCNMHDALIVVRPKLYMNMLAQNSCCC